MIRNQQSNLSEESRSPAGLESAKSARSRTLTESSSQSDQGESNQVGQITDVPITILETKKSKLNSTGEKAEETPANAQDDKPHKFDSKIIIHCPANFDANAVGGFVQPYRKGRTGAGRQPTKNCNSIVHKDIF